MPWRQYMDRKERREILEKLESEVKNLHPLLADLFPKLENIKNVEYTHGPDEMGADFVLEKYDPTLSTIVYVGVIAKIGKIHQNLDEIERQIKECQIKRYTRNGSREITLNEIWVVTNGNVTENAKQKINHNFSSSSIHFISGENLVDWIDRYTPYYWHSLPTLVGNYLLTTWNRNKELDQQLNLITPGKESFFVDLDIRRIDQASYKQEKKPML